ncbi:MAG: hypothetical protein IT365_29370 [Candidatus Hydrogenedentes bacterium]|nr:hypothetical protein [Candidatus Hydrogenedentota bacterium]
MHIRTACLLVALWTFTTLLGCPDNRGSFTPLPKLKFTDITLSQSRANTGDKIEIAWDYENADLLEQQSVQGIGLLLQGLSLTEAVRLENQERSFKFEFWGPITVVLMAEDEDTIDDDSKTADSVAFDILLDEDSHLTLHYRPVNTATEVPGAPAAQSYSYPRLGASDFSTHQIRFSQFVGFFDRPSEANGLIDELTPFLDSDSAFRALSASVEESDAFTMKQGSGYQLISASVPSLGMSNAYVFGGAIAYDGEEIPIKAEDDPEFVGRHGGVLLFEPVFMAIPLLVGFKNQAYDIVDIQLGNLSQGFVATLTTGTLNNGGDLLRGIQGTVDIDSTSDGNSVGTISGTIKGANIGFGVTTLGGDIFDSIVHIENVEWSMPFLFDTDLNSRLAYAEG